MSLLVFKIMKPSASFHGIAYNDKKQKKGEANLLYRNNFRHLQEGCRTPSKAEAIRFMEAFCSLNTRIRNKQFHAILSCKGKSISHEKLKAYGLEIIEKMGYGNNPVMIYGHSDTMHNHIHIITTRIGADGKKIPHHFERKRACEILQQIIGTDYKKEMNQDVKDVLQYHCSTIAQYRLLFEMKGYDTKMNEDSLELFKYGTRQGNVPLTEIEQKMKMPLSVNIHQIKALLFKYKKQYSSRLKNENGSKYTTAKPRLQSDLTEFMKQRFGMEFIFFTAKDHEKTPYGYVMIDHRHKAVIKGSDIMKLQELLQEHESRVIPSLRPERNTGEKEDTACQKEGSNEFENQESFYIPVERMINDIEHDVERDVHKEEHTQKRKRGRFI